MKKLISLLSLFIAFLPLKAEITYGINEWGIMEVYFTHENNSLTFDLFKADWDSAIKAAQKIKEVKQIHFKDKNGFTIAWAYRKDSENKSLMSLENDFQEIKRQCQYQGKYENIAVDTTKVQERVIGGAYYIKETYRNGDLINTYTSTWDSDDIEPSTSVYEIVGGDTYVIKTYIKHVTDHIVEKIKITYAAKLVETGELNVLKNIYTIKPS